MSTQYNGWSNYETWNVKLWLDNDGSDVYWTERAETLLKDNDGDEVSATGDLARELEAEIKDGELAPDLGASCYSDLLSAALGQVNWHEISESFIEQAKEAVEAA